MTLVSKSCMIMKFNCSLLAKSRMPCSSNVKTHTSGAAHVRVMLRGVGMPLSDQRAKSTSFMLKLLLNHMTLAGRRSP